MTLAEINPLAELTDGSFVAPRRSHGDGERGRRAGSASCWREQLQIAEDDIRETYEPSEFERNVAAIDAARPPRRDPGQGPWLLRQPRPRESAPAAAP